MFRIIIETLRPRQWIKNLVLFAGVVFDRQLGLLTPVLRVSAAFFIFCLVSGLTYTINDLLDYEADRVHPEKKKRPIASGRLSRKAAIFLAIVLALIAFPAAFLLSFELGLICVSYTLLMLLYSKWLKHIMIVDVLVIAIGFVLRVVAGLVVITPNYFSPWLFVLTSLVALFLGFGKRLSELKQLENQAVEQRKSFEGYSIGLLNQYILVILSAILITFCLYTFSAHPSGISYGMMYTIPFVFYGVFRYMYILQNSSLAAAPEEVFLRDRPLQISIGLWALAVILVLYLMP